MLHTNSLNGRADALAVRPIVLLAIVDQYVRAAQAYVLSAAGFDVVIPDAIGAFSTLHPDIVLIDLRDLGDDAYQSTQNVINDWLGDVPIVALVPEEVGHSSCELARRVGCAAACLATCSAEVLAAGLRAVLEQSRGHTAP